MGPLLPIIDLDNLQMFKLIFFIVAENAWKRFLFLQVRCLKENPPEIQKTSPDLTVKRNWFVSNDAARGDSRGAGAWARLGPLEPDERLLNCNENLDMQILQ